MRVLINAHRQMSRKGTRRIALTTLVLALSSLAIGCVATPAADKDSSPSYSATSPPDSDIEEVCERADEMTAADDPQGALEHIDQIRGAASDFVIGEGGADADLTEALSNLRLACEQQRQNALFALGEVKDSPVLTSAQQLGEAWKALATKWTAPLTPVWLTGLGMLAGLLLLARLLVLAPSATKKKPRYLHRPTKIVAAALLLLAPVGFVASLLYLSSTTTLAELAWIPLVVSLFAGIAGSFLLATLLASRLKLSVEARNAKSVDNWAAARLIALLNELGAERPRGLEIPRGSDVTALENALPDAPGGVWKTIKDAIAKLAGVTPWLVMIDSDETQRTTVTISRNGRAVAAMTIEPETLRVPPSLNQTRALDKLAAAAVLATLARAHEGFEALGGFGDWRSIGLHYIATTAPEYRDTPEMGGPILAQALEYDPSNLHAEVALQHALHRHATDPAELQRYADWLREASDRIAGMNRESASANEFSGRKRDRPQRGDPASPYVETHRRILYMYFVTVLNWKAARQGDDSWPPPELKRMGERLLDLLSDGSAGSIEFRDRMRPRAATVLIAADTPSIEIPKDWRESAEISSSPGTAYNEACRLAQDTPVPIEKVLERLGWAFQLPVYKTWAEKDPALKNLRNNQAFRDLMGRTTGDDFWLLEPFTPLKERLQDAGVAEPDWLAEHADDRDLRRYLKIEKPVFDRLVRISRLIRAAKLVAAPPEVMDVRVELVRALVAAGIETPCRVPTQPEQDPKVADLLEAVHERTWRVIESGKVLKWLVAVHALCQEGANAGRSSGASPAT
jgi:hypothetical protein